MPRFQFKLILLSASMLLMMSGCVSTAEPPQPASEDSSLPQQPITQSQQQAIPESTSSSDTVTDSVSSSEDLEAAQSSLNITKSDREIDQLNEQISLLATTNPFNNSVDSSLDRFSYTLGAGDVINIAVFQVDELNRKARITGDGYIMMPLIGEVYAQGLTTSELEDQITSKLAESYLHNPQVTVFIEEFRSHQISVTGAVKQPNIYEIQRAQNVLEMLAMAGGLSNDAGPQVYVTRIITDQTSGIRKRESTVIKLDTLLTSDDPRLNILLRAGDSVNVPKAGVVFVEGAVRSPGAYQIKGEMNVLKAIAVAGDVKFEAKRGNIQIFRELDGQTQLIEVDLDAIKSRSADDVALFDGDIIVVPDNKFKKGWSGFWKGISGIFSVGTRI